MLALALVAVGCSSKMEAKKKAATNAPVTVNCPSDITWDITDSAKVCRFACYVGDFKGKKMLIYEIEVRNVSNQPKRFRVQIVNPEGKSVGGLIPRKGKPPVLKPGEAKSFKYPVKGYLEIPKKLEVYVMELK